MISTLDESGTVTWLTDHGITKIIGNTRRDVGSIFYSTNSVGKMVNWSDK